MASAARSKAAAPPLSGRTPTGYGDRMKRRPARRPSPASSALRLSLLAAIGAGGCVEDQDPADAALPDAEQLDGSVDVAPDLAVDVGPDVAPPDMILPPPDMALPDGAPPPAPCEGAAPIMTPEGTPSGAVRCPDGAIDRVAAEVCEPRVDLPACPADAEGNEGGCAEDADCTDGPHGRCVQPPLGGGIAFCACRYGCATDSDCGEDEVCICAGVVDGSSRCVPAGCDTGADCDSGECGISSAYDGCDYSVRTACRAPDDLCRTDDECREMATGDTCEYTNGWGCQFQPVCGRPLTVDGAARTAAATPRGDWRTPARPALEALSAAERRALTRWWSQLGGLEHASVASFARTTMQLLALGAPADLLADTQAAAADEVRHARLAYGLASAYAGRPLGPAPLDLHDVGLELEKAAIVTALVDEGCVGETLGAAEAGFIAEAADPTVAEVGRGLVVDESRHAGLAWRTLKWLLADEALIPVAEAALARAADRLDAADYGDGPHLPAHGLPGPDARRALHRAAFADVVRPCAEALGLRAPA